MWNKTAFSVQRSAFRKTEIKKPFIRFLYAVRCALYAIRCTLCAVLVAAPVWGQDELIVSQVITSPQIISYVRSTPTQERILDVPSTSVKLQQNGPGWNTYSLSSVISANANVVFLSVWAICEDVSGGPAVPEGIFGFVAIRQPGQTDWSWRRDVEDPYHYQDIYMDGSNSPFYLVCPVNESGQIEYRYEFDASGSLGTEFKYQFYITVLGYLEGTYED